MSGRLPWFSPWSSLGLDDWLSAVALVLVIGMGACLIVGVAQRVMGYPTPLPSEIDSQEAYQHYLADYEKLAKVPATHPSQTMNILITGYITKNEFYYQLLMIAAYGCIKLSLIFFYRRLLTVIKWSAFDIVCLVHAVLIVMWALALFLLFLFGCKTKIYLHWAPLSEVQRQCGDPLAPEMALVVSDLVTDLMILALPMPIIWRLQMKWTRKLSVSLVFLVGLLAIAASIARMAIYIIVTYTGLDAGYDLDRTVTTMLWWSMVEACLGLMTSCLPVLSGLARAWVGGLFTRLSSRSRSRSRSSGGSGPVERLHYRVHLKRSRSADAELEAGAHVMVPLSLASTSASGRDGKATPVGESRAMLLADQV
ncbi:hypothetical protein BDV10DRAFT_184229 [Aspergillus recurvatus]